MMKFIILSFFILFSAMKLAGQGVIDIKADYIELNSKRLLYYSKMNNNSFKVSYGDFEGYNDLTIYNKDWTKSLGEIDSLVQIGKLISVDEIRYLNLDQLKNELVGKTFYFKPHDDFKLLKNVGQGLFGYGRIKNDFENDNYLDFYELYRIVPIRINENKMLYQFVGLRDRDLDEYFIPLKQGYSLSGEFESLEIPDKELISKWDVQWRENSETYEMYNIEEHFIYDNLKTKKLLNIKFDSLLEYNSNNHIVGFKDKEIFVYDVFLKDITPQNLRSFSYFNNRCKQVLIGNEIKYLSNSGSVNDIPLEDNTYYCGLGVADKTRIKEVNNTYYLEHDIEVRTQIEDDFLGWDYKIIDLKTEVDLFFLDQYLSFPNGDSSQMTNFYINWIPNNNFLIFKNKQEQYVSIPFIITYEVNDDGFEINHKLKIQYDLLQTYDALDYNKNQNTTVVKKDNLKGYLGINKKPKYKTLEKFQGSFARFELPDGRKGWLQTNAKEFLDQ
jgi:hypothetical protein